MAMDFPASPTVGQIYSPAGGPVYKWDGSLWVPQQGVAPANQLHAGVRVRRVDGSTLGFDPVNGGMLIIDGVSRPVVSVTKSIVGVTADAIRYIYAFWTGTAIDYEWIATTHATAANGVEIKSGDPTRTLVGMMFYSSVYFFQDNETYRFLANWFETSRREALVRAAPAGLATVTATAQTAIATGWALMWANTAVDAHLTGYFYSSGGANTLPVGGVFIDGINAGVETHAWMTVANAYYQCAASGGITTTTDKLISFQPTGRVGGGTSFQMGVALIVNVRM